MKAGFGERLRKVRLSAGISQVELAGTALSPSYISLLEAGKRQPSEDVVRQLSERLGCTVADLCDPVSREDAERAQLEINYARLAMANGEAADARTRLRALQPVVATDRWLTDEVSFLLAEAHAQLDDFPAAVEALLPVYERSLARTTHLPTTTVGLRLTRYYIESGDLASAIRVGEAGLRAMVDQGLEDTDEYLRAAATVMNAYFEIGDLAHAGAWGSQLIQRAERRGSLPGQAALYWNAALVAETQGRLTDALQLSQRAVALLSEQSPSRNLGRLYLVCASLIMRIDPLRVVESVALLDQALPLVKDHGSPLELAVWECNRAQAYLLVGDVAQAEDLARHAKASMAGHPGASLAEVTITLGDCLVKQGRLTEAAAEFRAAHRALTGGRLNRHAAALWRELGDRLAEVGDAELVVTAYRTALDAAGVRSPAVPMRVEINPEPGTVRRGSGHGSGHGPVAAAPTTSLPAP